MIIIYKNNKTYLGVDSRLTFNNGSYSDDNQKLFCNKDNTIAITATGIFHQKVKDIMINIPQEISSLYFKENDIFEILNAKRIDDMSYLDIIGDGNLSLFIAEKDKKPKILDINSKEINFKIIKTDNFYVNGNYSHDGVLDNLAQLTKTDMNPQEIIIDELSKIIFDANKNEVSTIGGKIHTIAI